MNKTNTETKNSVGRPRKSVNLPKVPFTFVDAVKKNPKACGLTVRKAINSGLASNYLMRLAAKQDKDAKAGRPVFRFIVKAQHEANLARLATANAKKAVKA